MTPRLFAVSSPHPTTDAHGARDEIPHSLRGMAAGSGRMFIRCALESLQGKRAATRGSERTGVDRMHRTPRMYVALGAHAAVRDALLRDAHPSRGRRRHRDRSSARGRRRLAVGHAHAGGRQWRPCAYQSQGYVPRHVWHGRRPGLAVCELREPDSQHRNEVQELCRQRGFGPAGRCSMTPHCLM